MVQFFQILPSYMIMKACSEGQEVVKEPWNGKNIKYLYGEDGSIIKKLYQIVFLII